MQTHGIEKIPSDTQVQNLHPCHGYRKTIKRISSLSPLISSPYTRHENSYQQQTQQHACDDEASTHTGRANGYAHSGSDDASVGDNSHAFAPNGNTMSQPNVSSYRDTTAYTFHATTTSTTTITTKPSNSVPQNKGCSNLSSFSG